MATVTPARKPISNTGWSQDVEMPADRSAVLVAYTVLELGGVVIALVQLSELIRALSLLAHLLMLAAGGAGV